MIVKKDAREEREGKIKEAAATVDGRVSRKSEGHRKKDGWKR
jgi:hypothetical protein